MIQTSAATEESPLRLAAAATAAAENAPTLHLFQLSNICRHRRSVHAAAAGATWIIGLHANAVFPLSLRLPCILLAICFNRSAPFAPKLSSKFVDDIINSSRSNHAVAVNANAEIANANVGASSCRYEERSNILKPTMKGTKEVSLALSGVRQTKASDWMLQSTWVWPRHSNPTTLAAFD